MRNSDKFWYVCPPLCLARSQSSCEITLEPPKPGVNERVITIVGSSNGIQFAQQLMQNRLERECVCVLGGSKDQWACHHYYGCLLSNSCREAAACLWPFPNHYCTLYWSPSGSVVLLNLSLWLDIADWLLSSQLHLSKLAREYVRPYVHALILNSDWFCSVRQHHPNVWWWLKRECIGAPHPSPLLSVQNDNYK